MYNIDVTWQYRFTVPVMSASKPVKKKNGHSAPAEEPAEGLWVDTALISRLHGRRSSPLATNNLTIDAESQRLLHYADVLLGTDKKEKFVSAKPTKERPK
jgi:hypothetical protein